MYCSWLQDMVMLLTLEQNFVKRRITSALGLGHVLVSHVLAQVSVG